MEARLACRRVDQKRQDLSNFEKTSRPSVNKQERDCTPDGTFLVDIVNIQSPETVDVDVSCELREFCIQLGLLGTPVEAGSPPLDQSLNVSERRT